MKKIILAVITLLAMAAYMVSMIAVENENWILFWILFGSSMTWFSLFSYANLFWKGAKK